MNNATMFTEEEQPLLSGTFEEVEEFVDYPRCMIVERVGTETKVIDEAIRCLPNDSLTYELSFPETQTAQIRMKFQDREDVIRFEIYCGRGFDVLNRVRKLLQPDYDIKVFRCMDGFEIGSVGNEPATRGCLLRPTEWWTDYQASYPEQYAKVFSDDDLSEF